LYAAVRDNLVTLLAEASGVGRGLPRYVERDFARYLERGVLAHGFAAPARYPQQASCPPYTSQHARRPQITDADEKITPNPPKPLGIQK
jgi:hypothetical protein